MCAFMTHVFVIIAELFFGTFPGFFRFWRTFFLQFFPNIGGKIESSKTVTGVPKETEAKIVREKLIKEFKDVFKDKLEKDGNINMEEVKLEPPQAGTQGPRKKSTYKICQQHKGNPHPLKAGGGPDDVW